MGRRVVVYLSGPITNGGAITSEDNIAANIWASQTLATKLMSRGYSVINPNLTGFVYFLTKAWASEEVRKGLDCLTYEQWLNNDLGIINTVDVVLRWGGESKGADEEVYYADDHEIPVCRSWDELIANFKPVTSAPRPTEYREMEQLSPQVAPSHPLGGEAPLAMNPKLKGPYSGDLMAEYTAGKLVTITDNALYPGPSLKVFSGELDDQIRERVKAKLKEEERIDTDGREHFESGAMKDNEEGRGDFSLLPWHALLQWAEHLRRGKIKYSRDNWKAGIPLSRIKSAILRHASQLGEEKSENHLAAILCEAGFACHFIKEIQKGNPMYADLDDLGISSGPMY